MRNRGLLARVSLGGRTSHPPAPEDHGPGSTSSGGRTPPPPTPSRRLRWAPGAELRGASAERLLWLLLVPAVLELLRLVWSVGRTVTNDDNALLWFAAGEWGRFQLHQPNFYGQSYGTTLESIPVELLRRAGLELWTATPLVLGVLTLTGWVLLALAAWRRGHRLLAGVALAAPLVLSAYHATFTAIVPSVPVPRFLVVAGTALLIVRPDRAWVETAGWSLLGLAVLTDTSSALLAVPVALWALLDRPLSRGRIQVLVAGAVLPGAYLAWWLWFYERNPDHNLHGGLSVVPDGGTLVESLGEPARFFELFRPELLPSWTVPVVALALLVVALTSARQTSYLVPALSVPALVLMGMAVPKSQDVLGPWLPSGRLFLLLPHALWFLALLAVEAGVVPRPPRRLAWALAVGVAMASVAVRTVAFPERVLAERDDALTASVEGEPFRYSFVRTGTVVERCREVRAGADRLGATLAVFVFDRLLGYACGALHHGELDTLTTTYERRTWLLSDELRRERTALVLADAPTLRFFGIDCGRVGPYVDSCEPVEGGGLGVTFPRQSALALLASLDVPVRPFGPECRPEVTDGLLVSCDEPLELPHDVLVVGPPPSDESGARRDVARAFDRAVGAGDLEAVERGRELAHGLRPSGRRAARDAGASADVRVEDVRFLDDRQAVVDLAVAVGGTEVGPGSGRAVRTGGRWRVKRTTYCPILEALGPRCP